MSTSFISTYAKAPHKFIESPLGVTYAYRELGPISSSSSTDNQNDIPIVMFLHLGATLDNWDPRIIDALAQKRHVIAFNQRGVGLSTGSVPGTVEEMADHAYEFMLLLGIKQADLFGFSLGGFVIMDLILRHPEIGRKLVLTGTGPRGGKGIENVGRVTYTEVFKSFVAWCDPLEFLFFNRDSVGKQAGRDFISRLNERKQDRDKGPSVFVMSRQLSAIHRYGKSEPMDLSKITHPTLIANGDNDKMVPSVLSQDMAKRIPGSELIIYPNSGHGGIFQYHEEFAPKVVKFLTSKL